MVASWSSSLEPKWANSPLLLMASSVASRPMVRPSRPSTEARSAAVCRIAVLVRVPLVVARRGMGPLYGTIVRASLGLVGTNDRASTGCVAVIRHGLTDRGGVWGRRPPCATQMPGDEIKEETQ